MTEAAPELDEWVSTLLQELGLTDRIDVDIALILDLARDAAHGVARPAAPVTTFLVGYAAGLDGGSTESVTTAVTRALAALPADTSAAE